MPLAFVSQLLRLMLVPGGALVAIIAGVGVAGNYDEWSLHSCGGPPPLFPVCGAIFWLIIVLLVLASAGIALMIYGLGVRLGRLAPQTASSFSPVARSSRSS